MSKRQKYGTFNAAEIQYLRALCSPFDPLSNTARVCDDFSSRSRAATLSVSGTHTVPASGITSFLLMLRGGLAAGTGRGVSFSIYDDETPTGMFEKDFDQDTEYDALNGSTRIVGAGVKVWSTASETETQGTVTAGNVNLPIMTAAATYNTASTMESAMDERGQYLSKDGITVRWQPVEEDDKDFATLGGGTAYSVNDMRANPCVVCRGWAATQTIYYQVVVHLEVRTFDNSLTIETDSPFGANFALLMATANAFPTVVEGHSFLKWAKFAVKAAAVAAQLVSTGAAAIGPLIATV